MALSRIGKRVRFDHLGLRQDADLGTSLSDHHLAGGRGHARLHRYSIHQDPERLLPHSGYRRHSGRLGSGTDDLVRGDVGTPAGGGEDNFEGPGRRQSVLFYWHRWDQYYAEYGAHSDQPERSGGAENQRQRRNSPLAASARAGSRHDIVYAAGTGSDGGGSGEPHAIPVHHGRSERGRA